jgi:hypothetical protein
MKRKAFALQSMLEVTENQAQQRQISWRSSLFLYEYASYEVWNVGHHGESVNSSSMGGERSILEPS